MGKWINEHLIPKILAFVNTKAVQSIKDGMVYTMPLLIVGSIFLILANLPVKQAADALAAAGITTILNQACGATFNISAIIAVIGISYTYVKLEKQEPLSGSMIALAVFLLLQPSSVQTESGDLVSNIINKDWTAGKGMIGAIIIGLLVGYLYSWFLKKNIKIKMPNGVPAGVANAFSALIPAVAIVILATIIHGIFSMGLHTTAIEAIYKIIQTPLQGMTDSLGGALLMCFTGPFLWIFGVHGTTIVGGVMSGLLQANSLENQAILDKGLELTVANGGHIVTAQFYDLFINVTGAGLTIGLVIYLVAFAKAKQFRTLGKLELIPALFNINEPIMFGLPIVMNPMLAVPFILMPVIACVLQYFALATGLCPLYAGVMVPWTCPPIISGFLVGGWRSALLQIVILTISFFVYMPFIRRLDRETLAAEAAAEANPEDEDW